MGLNFWALLDTIMLSASHLFSNKKTTGTLSYKSVPVVIVLTNFCALYAFPALPRTFSFLLLYISIKAILAGPKY